MRSLKYALVIIRLVAIAPCGKSFIAQDVMHDKIIRELAGGKDRVSELLVRICENTRGYLLRRGRSQRDGRFVAYSIGRKGKELAEKYAPILSDLYKP